MAATQSSIGAAATTVTPCQPPAAVTTPDAIEAQQFPTCWLVSASAWAFGRSRGGTDATSSAEPEV